MSSKRKLVLFDFDGTITDRDTLFDFLKFNTGKLYFYTGLLLLVPVFGLLFLRIIPNWRAKELMLTWFLRKMPLAKFNEKCAQYSTHHLQSIIRPQALKEILNYKKENFEVVVVTASPENWVKPWCDSLGISCIGTKLQSQDLLITGKIMGKNCYGYEKVKRIKKEYNLDEFEIEAAFGDSKGDEPMMLLAKRKYYKPFRISAI